MVEISTQYKLIKNCLIAFIIGVLVLPSGVFPASIACVSTRDRFITLDVGLMFITWVWGYLYFWIFPSMGGTLPFNTVTYAFLMVIISLVIAIFGTIVSAITIKKINREDKAVASIVRSIKIFFILAGLGLNVVLLVTNNSWYPYGILVPSPFGTYILILGVVILISCIKPNRTTEISAGDVSGQRSWFPRHTHILEGFSKNWITWSVILGIANVSVVPSIVGAMLYGIYIFPHYDMNYNWILVSGAIVFLLIGAIAGGIGILKDRFNKVAIVGFIINITGLLVIISSEILIGYFGQVWLGYIIPPVP